MRGNETLKMHSEGLAMVSNSWQKCFVLQGNDFSFKCEASCSFGQWMLLLHLPGDSGKAFSSSGTETSPLSNWRQETRSYSVLSKALTDLFWSLLISLHPLKKLLLRRRGREVRIVFCVAGTRSVWCLWVGKGLGDLLWCSAVSWCKSRESALFMQLLWKMGTS